MTRLRALIARAAAALALLAILIAPPVGVVAVIGRPYPAWDRLRDELASGRLTDDTTMRVTATIGLVLWVWAVVVIAAETRQIVQARRSTQPAQSAPPSAVRRSRPGILVQLVRLALVGTVSTAATVSSIASTALATTTPSLHAALTTAPVPDAAPASVDPVGAVARTITASGRETPLSVAVALGEEGLRDQIIALNTGPDWSGGVFPAGMSIRLPAGLPAPPDADVEPGRGEPESELVTYVVEPGDTLWDITEDLYGATTRELTDQIAERNELADPNVIEIGQTLVLPASAHIPVPTAQSVDSDAVRIVVRGDNLWRIVADHYGTADDELVDYIAAFNGIENKSLIFPGQQILLESTTEAPAADETPTDEFPATPNGTVEPAPTATTATTPGTAGPTPPASTITPAEPTRDTRPVPDGAPGSSEPVDARAPEPAVEPPATSTSPPTPIGPLVPPARQTVGSPPPTTAPPAIPPVDSARSTTSTNIEPAGSAEAARTTTSGPIVAILAGIGGSVVLACGLLVRMRWLRRRRAVRGAPDPAAVAAVEGELLRTADVALVRWASQRMAVMSRALDRRHVTAAPAAVEICDTSGIEVLWDAPQHARPPAGWTSTDGGWGWRCSYDPDAELPGADLPASIPGLVTVGEREGRQLLVDLEALATLGIVGDPAHATALARSIAIELACGDELADAYVLAVDLDIDPTIAPLGRLTVTTVEDAAREVDRVSRAIGNMLGNAGVADTFRARLGDVPPIEVTVAVFGDGDVTAPALEGLGPRRGAAVVAVCSRPTTDAYIEIAPDGANARLEPLGITFTPAGLPAAAVAAVATTVAQLYDLPDEVVPVEHAGRRIGADLATPDEPNGRSGGPGAAGSNGDAYLDELSPDAFRVEPEPSGHVTERMVVRVLGVPGVHDRPDLGRRERILTVLLACRGEPIAASTAQDAIWGGRAIEPKTLWNVVTATRRALGNFADETPVFPATDRSRSRLHLDPRVTTDLALLQQAVDRADALPSNDAIGCLRDALEWVTGPPFDAPGFDWAFRDQYVNDATQAIALAVERLVELGVDAGQFDVARDGVARGLRGLPGDERLARLRMRLEAAAGNTAGVVAAYDELATYLADLEAEPAAATTALLNDLRRGHESTTGAH